MASVIQDVGRVMPIYRGEYDPTQSYERPDIVSLNGSSYWCTYMGGSIKGIPPTNREYWGVLADTSIAVKAAQEATERANTEEDKRAGTETIREQNEDGRKTGEADRVNAESDRAVEEAKRVGAESIRVNAELSRGIAESERVTTENARKTAETGRANAESGRVTEEDKRVTAESGRATAESGRASAELSRTTAESGRASAETTRVSNETTRNTQEQTRQSQEAARQTSMNTIVTTVDDAKHPMSIWLQFWINFRKWIEDSFKDNAALIQTNTASITKLEADDTPEIKTVTLTNTQQWPFNNSQQTVSLSTNRATTNYTVDAEIKSATGGQVQAIKITDRLANGFKISFEGDATSAVLKLIIKGGINR